MDKAHSELYFGQPTPPEHLLIGPAGSDLVLDNSTVVTLEDIATVGDPRWVVVDARNREPYLKITKLEQLAGQLVNQLRAGVTVVCGDAHDEFQQVAISLGFVRLPQANGPIVYRYALEDANPGREWNTPEHWAHPQNFDKR